MIHVDVQCTRTWAIGGRAEAEILLVNPYMVLCSSKGWGTFSKNLHKGTVSARVTMLPRPLGGADADPRGQAKGHGK